MLITLARLSSIAGLIFASLLFPVIGPAFADEPRSGDILEPYIKTAQTFVGLIANYQPATAEQNFVRALSMLDAEEAEFFKSEMLNVELRAIRDTGRTCSFTAFPVPATVTMEENKTLVRVTIQGTAARSIGSHPLPERITTYRVDFKIQPRSAAPRIHRVLFTHEKEPISYPADEGLKRCRAKETTLFEQTSAELDGAISKTRARVNSPQSPPSFTHEDLAALRNKYQTGIGEIHGCYQAISQTYQLGPLQQGVLNAAESGLDTQWERINTILKELEAALTLSKAVHSAP